MRKYLSLIVVVSLFFLSACDSGGSASVDGTYKFDTQAWQTNMEKVNPAFSQSPPEMINKMMEAFGSFNMVIKGKEATANFGKMVVKGNLEEVSKTKETIKYKMTPLDPEKAKQPIFIEITGKTMKAGPENKPNEVLYFVKM